MALINAKWNKLGIPISVSEGWTAVKKQLGELDDKLPEKGVYIFRTVRPFSIAYPKRPSPVLYIGEGRTEKRIRNHFKTWVVDIAKDFPSLKVEIQFVSPRVRNNDRAHRDVEADLIWEFSERYSALPLLNRQYEYHDRVHRYSAEFFDVLNPGKGSGFKWAILPIASNNHFIRPREISV